MKTKHEDGIALVLALLLMTVMSVLAVSLMFLSQTEAYSSMNYRMTSQARYAAESGVQKAAAFLLDRTQYALPTAVGGADPVTAYNRTVSPVTYNNQAVILSASATQASNYPVAAVQTAFNAAAQGNLTAGRQTLTYAAYATLLSMQVFDSYAGGQDVIQTWLITGDGGLTGSRTATVEVSAIVEIPLFAGNTFAAYATSNQCGAISLGGNVATNSYDSYYGSPSTTTTALGGDVGTNGNLTTTGSVSIGGTLYTPVQGVGSCTNGATGASEGYTGSASAVQGIVQRPALNFPLPTFSATPPTNTVTVDATALGAPATACSSLGLTLGTNCSVSGSTITVDGHSNPVTMPSVVLASGITMIFNGGNPPNDVNINSLTGSGTVQVNANLTSPTQNQEVVLKIAGKNPDGTDMAVPFDLSTMSWKQNTLSSNYDASSFQIVYGGTATINMQGGNSQSAATIYAPNATFNLLGTQDFYGSILAKTVSANGTPAIHYDRNLRRSFFVAGTPMMGTFSWKRF